jgi:hypothetical protein
MEQIKALWRGKVALGEAFWTWAVFGGLMVNLSTSLLLLVLVMLDQLWLALIIGKGLSLPYNLVVVIGVWRAAAVYEGPGFHADLARGTVLVMMIILSVT